MRPALRKDPPFSTFLQNTSHFQHFYKNTPIFHFFGKKNTPVFHFLQNTPIFHFFYKKHPHFPLFYKPTPFHYLPTGLDIAARAGAQQQAGSVML